MIIHEEFYDNEEQTDKGICICLLALKIDIFLFYQ